MRERDGDRHRSESIGRKTKKREREACPVEESSEKTGFSGYLAYLEQPRALGQQIMCCSTEILCIWILAYCRLSFTWTGLQKHNLPFAITVNKSQTFQ